MELECGYSPTTKQSQSYLLAPTHSGLGQGRCWKFYPGKSTAVRRSCFLPHSTDIDTSPPPIPRLRRFEPPAWQAACWSWITSPVAKSCVYGLCAFCCWGVFPVLTLYSPRSIVWGLFFFSSPSSCYAVSLFNSLSSCPVYPLVIYVCCVCMDRLMANFTGTCD